MNQDIKNFYENAGYLLKKFLEKEPKLRKTAEYDNIISNLRNGTSVKRQLNRLQEFYQVKEENFQKAFEYVISFKDFNLTGKTGFVDYKVAFEKQLL